MGQDEDDNVEAKRDNRGAKRDRVLKSGQVIFGNSVLDCILLDVSVSGARLSFSTPVPVPEVVALRLSDGSTYPARRAWTRGAEVGLEFTGRVGASGDQGHIRRAWAALQAVQVADPVSWLQILQAERFFGDETLHQAAKAAEAAHMRLEAALRPHAVRMEQGGPKAKE
jgi:hypothetical protein